MFKGPDDNEQFVALWISLFTIGLVLVSTGITAIAAVFEWENENQQLGISANTN